MSENLDYNSKFIGFKGVIGRHDYFLNLIYLLSINLFFTIPYSIWLYSKINSFEDMLNTSKYFTESPILLKSWILIGTLFITIVMVSNIFRRLNDINGKVNNILNILYSIPFILTCFTYFMPLICQITVAILCFIMGLILLFKSGKETSQLPYDYKNEFNWGAFFGTWLWGLFNKSFIPLWDLILFFTPWSFYFKLICGLKGNEWAYKNKKWDDVIKFNKSQEKQTTIFIVLYLIVIPVILFALVVFGTFSLFNGISDMEKNNPEKFNKIMETVDNSQKMIIDSYFKSYEIGEEQNKFYVDSEDWNYKSFSDKCDMLRFAATFAASEKTKAQKSKDIKDMNYYSQYTELKITKLYSSQTNKLLGEFIWSDDNAKDFKSILKQSFNSYHFYNDTDK